MKCCKISCVVFAILGLLTAASAFGAISAGNGYSAEKDPEKAGAEAAQKAKEALGGDAKVVLVFDSAGNKPADKEAMLKGVTSVFKPEIVYGCSAYAPITQESNTGTVGVLAIGGDVKVNVAVSDLEGGHEACGKRIGEALKKASSCDAPGRFVILVGDCHVPKNDPLVKGAYSVLGDKVGIAGGAAMGGFVYNEGECIGKEKNIGIMLCGDFTCSFSAKNAPGNKPDEVVAVAGEAAANAVGKDKDKLKLVFAFDCGGRRGQMKGAVDEELGLIKDAVGGAPIFGFYGSGETGPKDNDSPPCGVGFHIVICAISQK